MGVGRNDACPCGSGKKYKKCCQLKERTLSVRSSNNSEAIAHHSVFDGEKWHKVPGALAVRIGMVRTEDRNIEIDSLFEKISRVASDKSAYQILKKLDDCKHKLYAVEFHLKQIVQEIKERAAEFERNYSAASGAAIEIANHVLIYETEAFLFQVKSNLDLMVQVMGQVIPSLKSFRTFSHSGTHGTQEYAAGGKVIKQLRASGEIDMANLFDAHRTSWIEEMTIMRDTITHYSGLRGFHCFVEEPYRGDGQVQIHYPTMPSGERVDAYCEKIHGQLCGLYRDAFERIEGVVASAPKSS
ncbi:MAG: SEC-C metal-binding domain-containing protein [Nitrospirota bacterium]